MNLILILNKIIKVVIIEKFNYLIKKQSFLFLNYYKTLKQKYIKYCKIKKC